MKRWVDVEEQLDSERCTDTVDYDHDEETATTETLPAVTEADISSDTETTALLSNRHCVCVTYLHQPNNNTQTKQQQHPNQINNTTQQHNCDMNVL